MEDSGKAVQNVLRVSSELCFRCSQIQTRFLFLLMSLRHSSGISLVRQKHTGGSCFSSVRF